MSALRQVYLEPGAFHFGAAPLRLSTLLGSCVTVTLWHPRRHIGGMCHIQMPRRPVRAADAPLDGRYADDAFLLFDQALARHGTPTREYVAKMFGGGNMFPGTRASAMDVGNRNVAATRQQLAARHIRPVTEHVGGAGHRKLVFDLANGDVWLTFNNLEGVKEAASG
jgi:chemotaxis protein CheD